VVFSSSAVMPGTLPMARRCRAVGQRTRHHRLTYSDALQLQPVTKAEYRYRQAPQCLGSLAHRHQRPACAAWTAISGSAAMLGRQSLSLGGNPTSPLYFVRCSVGYVSGHGGVPPCPGTTKLSRGVRGSCGSRPLRQSYITPHCPQCPAVAALKLRLVPVTAARPSGEGNRRYAKLPSLGTVAQPSALPGRIRALRAASWLLCGCCGTVALVRRFAQRSGQWPAASHLVCAPPTLWASPRFAGIGPALVSPSAPKGLPQPSAKRHSSVFLVAIKCIAACAYSAGATGRFGL
jgi:hypothetical protein